jgi:hypothetical protein
MMKDLTNQNSDGRSTYCSFCKIPKEATLLLIEGKNGCICPGCALGVHQPPVEKQGRNKYYQVNNNAVIVIIILAIAT